MKKEIIKIKYVGDTFFIKGLNELKDRFGFELSEDGKNVCANKCTEKIITVNSDGNNTTFTYYDNASFYRAFTIALQKLIEGGGQAQVKPLIHDLGTMQNCAYTVINVETVKGLIRDHAIMGYNYIQLYTETTYEIPSEPYFGFKLNKYTQKELKELVEYSKIFGVEMIPCIQTLAHLSQLFNWGAFGDVHDIRDTLLVNYPRTYELIDKMLESVAECFDTEKINLGMDEGYFMGFGRYNWFVDDSKPDRAMLFIDHVKKVMELAEKHGFKKPSIWFDNLFGMNYKGYIDPPEWLWTDFPEYIQKAFPNIRMIFWNYVIRDVNEFSRQVGYIRQLSKDVSFASMAHGYTSFAPENYISAYLVDTAREGCLKNGIDDIMITWWGGKMSPYALNPAYYDFAERLCESQGIDVELRSKFLFGYTYKEFCELDSPNVIGKSASALTAAEGNNLPFYALANDPLLGKLDMHVPVGCEDEYKQKSLRMGELSKVDSPYAFIFDFEKTLCELLSVRAELGLKIKDAYDKDDKAQLLKIAKGIPAIIKETEKFRKKYIEYYMTYSKAYGREAWDIKLGGACSRLRSVAEILKDYAKGKIKNIPELDEERLPINKNKIGQIISYRDWESASHT